MTAPDPKDGPTQAQIEAAAEALERLWMQDEPWGDFKTFARAALTAAAEAGQYAFNQPKTGTPSPSGSFEITAAAAAGKPPKRYAYT